MRPAIESLRDAARRAGALAIGPQAFLAGAGFMALGVLTFSPAMLSDDALIPTVVILLFVAACIAALAAGRGASDARDDRRPLTYWDVAGVLTLIGIGISAAVEPEQMVRLVESAHREP
jgi:hypothetical protein